MHRKQHTRQADNNTAQKNEPHTRVHINTQLLSGRKQHKLKHNTPLFCNKQLHTAGVVKKKHETNLSLGSVRAFPPQNNAHDRPNFEIINPNNLPTVDALGSARQVFSRMVASGPVLQSPTTRVDPPTAPREAKPLKGVVWCLPPSLEGTLHNTSMLKKITPNTLWRVIFVERRIYWQKHSKDAKTFMLRTTKEPTRYSLRNKKTGKGGRGEGGRPRRSTSRGQRVSRHTVTTSPLTR